MTDNKEEEKIESIKIIDTKETADIEVDEIDEKINNKNNFIKEVLNYLILIVLAFTLAQVIHRYVFTPVTVDGNSMLETLHDKDYLFLWRRAKINRFDIVVFDVKDDTDPYIKRVIGLPGDYVKMENDMLYINEEVYDEPYLEKRKNEAFYNGNFTSNFTLENICTISNVECNKDGKIIIPDGYYLVLGDNRINSRDSRELGLIKKSDIIGEANFILYPFNRFGKIAK